MSYFLLKLLSFSCMLNAALGRCPTGAIQGPTASDCYYYTTSAKPWQQAEDDCVARGGHLVSISGNAPNGFLLKLPSIQASTGYWIGGSIIMGPTGGWAWSDGSSFSYKNWGQGQPTTAAVVCTVFNTRNGQWYSEACSSVKPYICRVKPAASTGAPCDICRTGTCPSPPPPQRARPLCESGWTYWAVNGKCYKKVSGMKTWPIHEKMCNLLGAHLTSIHSIEEQEFLKNMSSTGLPMPGCQPTYCSAGMALGLKMTAGAWSWVDGTAVDYTNWGGNGQRPFADRQYSTFYPETFQDPGTGAIFNSKWDNYLYDAGMNRGTVCKRDY